MVVEREQARVVVPHSQRLSQAWVAWLLWGAMAFCAAMLAWLSVARYLGYNARMFDLGNMAQSIASIQRGRPLVFTYSDGPMSRLALHVEFFYFLLAPLYALWPDPRLLLIVQAVLFAVGAIPVYRLALRRTNDTLIAVCFGLLYLVYPVAQTSVLMDIHGDTFAMPLLLFALDALDRRAWCRYALLLGLALSCKFYVAIPVVLMSMPIWWRYGNRKVALLTAVAGLCYGAFAFLVVRPLFTTQATSTVHRDLHYISFYFGQVDELLSSWDWRLSNLLVILGPALLLVIPGWQWLLPGLPIIIASLLSTVNATAGYNSHHYALAVPFIVGAAIEGAVRLRQRAARQPARRQDWRGRVIFTLLIVLIFNLAFVATPLSPLFWLGGPQRGLGADVYGVTARDRVKDRFLQDAVPAQAPLAASIFLAPHLADRDTLYLVRYESGERARPFSEILAQVDYVVADALIDIRQRQGGGLSSLTAGEQEQIGQALRDPTFGLVATRDGLLVFQRNAAPSQTLMQQVIVEQASPPVQSWIGDTIGLVDAHILPSGDRRYRASFRWVAGPHAQERSLVAISSLAGVPNMRVVHLPTYALLPTTQWQPGQVVEETFDVEFPRELAPGRYRWQLGWYDLSDPDSAATDQRSQIGATLVVAEIDVP